MLNNFVLFLIGAAIPIPLFFDIGINEILLHKFVVSQYMEGSTGAVPVGYVAFTLLILYMILKVRRWGIRNNLAQGAFLLTWFLFLASYVSIERTVSLTSCFIFAYIFSHAEVCRDFWLKFSCGYIASLITIFILKIPDTLFCGLSFCKAPDSRSLLGFEIYQYYVSYAAVMSLICVLSVTIVGLGRPRYIAFGVLMFLLSYNEALLTYRKAPVLEFAMLGLIFLGALLIHLYSTKRCAIGNPKRIVLTIVVLVVAIIGVFVSVSNFRAKVDISAISDRTASYAVAAKVVSNGALQKDSIILQPVYSDKSAASALFLGYEPGWGGYGNSFLEFFMRMGVMGLLFFIAALFLLAKDCMKILSCSTDQHNKSLVLVLSSVFIISVFIGSFVNMNLQLPYYYTNMLALVIVFGTFNKYKFYNLE